MVWRRAGKQLASTPNQRQRTVQRLHAHTCRSAGFDVDVKHLDRAYKSLQQQYHPDRHATAPAVSGTPAASTLRNSFAGSQLLNRTVLDCMPAIAYSSMCKFTPIPAHCTGRTGGCGRTICADQPSLCDPQVALAESQVCGKASPCLPSLPA